MRIQLYSAALILLLSMTANVPVAFADGDGYADIHTVAIVSALGNSFDVKTYGITRFGNDEYPLQADWNFDDLLKDDVTKAIDGRFQIKDVPTGSAFDGIAAASFDDEWADIKRRVLSLPAANGVDAYIVIIPWLYSAGGLESHGLSITHGYGFGSGTNSIGAYFYIGVVDARSGLRRGSAGIQRPVDRLFVKAAPPSASCSNELWADAADKWTPEQKSRIRQELVSLIGGNLGYTLRSVQLIGDGDVAAVNARFAAPGVTACQPDKD